MIKVTWIDSDNIEHYKSFNVRCRDLLCTTWDDVDYRWAFNKLEKLLNLPANSIQSWRVI